MENLISRRLRAALQIYESRAPQSAERLRIADGEQFSFSK